MQPRTWARGCRELAFVWLKSTIPMRHQSTSAQRRGLGPSGCIKESSATETLHTDPTWVFDMRAGQKLLMQFPCGASPRSVSFSVEI